jgi:hypothetical protein
VQLRHTHADARVVTVQSVEFRGLGAGDNHVAHASAFQTVVQIFGGEQTCRGDHHRAQFEGAEHRLPKSRFVAHDEKDAIATRHALAAQEVGHLR